MCETNTLVLESLAAALERMAFVMLMPQETPLPPASDPQRVCIEFGRPARGRLELLAGRRFGAMLVGNILGTSPDDPAAEPHACDAMKELLNVTCGELLTRKASAAPGAMDMGLAQVEPLDAEQAQRLLADGGFEVLDADGCPVAIRLVEMA